VSLFVQPVIFGFGVIFYLAIPTYGSIPRRRHDSALAVYEMTNAMGFSSD